MSRILVETQNLGKRYKVYPRPSDRLAEWWSLGRKTLHTDFWALRNFDFVVHEGECIGLIGSNGAGKSTLLRLLSKTLEPNEGSFKVEGRALSLLELGTGFNPELTGRQNVLNTASLLGLPDGYGQQRMTDIERFAELGEFIDRPTKTYSTGMTLRLAFSMFAFFDPDLLIIDEALAVGDVAFQRKCFRRMEELIEDSKRGVILVSHDLQSIMKLCTRVYWIDHGKLRMSGDPITTVQEYLRFMFASDPKSLPPPRAIVPAPIVPPADAVAPPEALSIPASGLLSRSSAAIVYPNHGVELLGFWLENAGGRPAVTIPVNEPFSICYALRFGVAVPRPVFGIRLATTRGDCMFATNTRMMQVPTRDFAAGQSVVVRWPIGPGLAVSDYFVSCGCSLEDDIYRFLMREVDGYLFSVVGLTRQTGLCSINGKPVIGTMG